jgi:hypothetical protein
LSHPTSGGGTGGEAGICDAEDSKTDPIESSRPLAAGTRSRTARRVARLTAGLLSGDSAIGRLPPAATCQQIVAQDAGGVAVTYDSPADEDK